MRRLMNARTMGLADGSVSACRFLVMALIASSCPAITLAQGALQQSMEELAAPDADVRSAAAVALGRMGADAAPAAAALTRALGDEAAKVRANAAWALARIGPAAGVALPELTGALSDDSPDVRGRAAICLGVLGDAAADAVGALRALVEDDDEAIVATAAGALWQVTGRPGDAVAILQALLESPDARTRTNAAGAIGRVGPPARQFAAALVRALEDPDAGVRAAAAQALGDMGLADDMVMEAVTRATGDEDETVRENARKALTKLGDAVPPDAREPATPDMTADADEVQSQPSREAVEQVLALVQRSLSLGVLDHSGRQLNPRIAPEGVSLTASQIAAHARLAESGCVRTVGEVAGFAAAAGARLAATGMALTVDDVLPDLRAYVTWALENQAADEALLGTLIASGTGRAAAPGEMDGEFALTPLTATMLLADLLIGVQRSQGPQGALGYLVPTPTVVWASHPRLADAGDTPAQRGIVRIKGLITTVEYAFTKAAETAPDWLTWAGGLVRMFELGNGLAVSVRQRGARPGEMDVVREIVLDRVGAPIQLTATVSPAGVPMIYEPDQLHYMIFLASRANPRGRDEAPLYDDADAELQARAAGFSPDRGRRLVAATGPARFSVHATLLDATQQRVALLVAGAQVPVLRLEDLSDEERSRIRAATRLSDAGLRALFERDIVQTLKPAHVVIPVYFRPSLPDLIATDGTGEIITAEDGTLTVRAGVTVRNVGAGPSRGEIAVRFLVTTPGGEMRSGTRYVTAVLEPGEAVTLDTGGTAKIDAVPVRCTVTVDPNDTLKESNETNNVHTFMMRAPDARPSDPAAGFPTGEFRGKLTGAGEPADRGSIVVEIEADGTVTAMLYASATYRDLEGRVVADRLTSTEPLKGTVQEGAEGPTQSLRLVSGMAHPPDDPRDLMLSANVTFEVLPDGQLGGTVRVPRGSDVFREMTFVAERSGAG